jgi:hypothetical protein
MGDPKLGEADPGGLGACPQKILSVAFSKAYSSCCKEVNSFCEILLFPEKEAKSVVPLRGRPWATQNSAKPTQGVWGHAPRKTSL